MKKVNTITKTKEKRIMCDTLNRLRKMSVDDILRETNQERSVPVDLDKIFDEFKIKKAAIDFSEMQKGITNKENFSGLVLLIENDVAIFYNIKDSFEKRRFVAAHEIGHCCCHAPTLKDGYPEFLDNNSFGFDDEHESEASDFASKLLIPTQSLYYVYNRMLKPTLKELSTMFQVPEIVMKKRLEKLGLEVHKRLEYVDYTQTRKRSGIKKNR